jgi:hypothetical protein
MYGIELAKAMATFVMLIDRNISRQTDFSVIALSISSENCLGHY